ncbi:MAG: glycoside hydrolase family 2 TIM barrel-domain containing protein [Lutimonas sp.]
MNFLFNYFLPYRCKGLITLLLIFNLSVYGQKNEETRTIVNINEGWEYAENDLKKLNATDNLTWESIDLPHTWNAEDVVDQQPGYRRSASWYKKTITFDEISPEHLYQIYFESANIVSEIYVNGQFAGKHIGGYVGFKIDLSKFIAKGENTILVRVDNGYHPEIIPSQQSDFFIYGGITRDVYLITEPLQHLGKIKINTPSVSKSRGLLNINAQIENLNSKDLKLQGILYDPNGKKVSQKTISVSGASPVINFKPIPSPMLWDTETPHLYKVTMLLTENGKLIDKKEEKFGFRWFEFKDHGPFFLNGKRLIVRGTHRHEEHAGTGAAMSNAEHFADLRSIKSMGANFVRLAHYPQDPEVYKACDELGLLVWDELPWCRGGVGNEPWKENTKRLLIEMIEQNYNHPSIIIWSLGNEMYWLPEFENGDKPELINPFLTELNEIAHRLDPYRKTAVRKYYEGADIVDVFSPSIWSGWYSGSYKSYRKAIDTYKKEYKHFIHAEYGGSSHVGRHSENPVTGEGVIKSEGWEEEIVQTQVDNVAKIGDWSENYIVDLFDWHLRISESDPDFVGNIQWAFKDFGTPLRPENDIPYMNQKGLTDRNGNPKDAYYVFKSYWSNEPFVYIESHTWTDRQGPEDVKRNISVFSNCEEVEFFLNGKSLGTKQKDIQHFPASGLNWDVLFKKGQNTLIAIGKDKSGREFKDEIEVNYRYQKNEPAKNLTLSYLMLSNGNFLVTAEAIDKNGLRCLNYEKKVYFQCLSGGETIKNQGTPTGSETISMANGKASIEVKPNENGNKIVMSVLNQDFKGTYLEIDTSKIQK